MQHRKTLQLALGSFLLCSLCGVTQAADFVYTVQPGDHPWNVAVRYLKLPSLAFALHQRNHIADDHHIAPGTQLRIPKEWLRLESTQVTLLAAVGDTTLRQGNTPARAAVAGELLKAPSGLHTGPDGSATLQFADGSRVLVRRDSELLVQTSQQSLLGKTSIVALSLLQGSVENQVTPMGENGGRFEIRTPAAIAAVRGTQYRVYAYQSDDGPAMRTEVVTGAVQVINANGKVMAQTAQGTVAQSGRGPDASVALLSAPSLEGLPETIERLPIGWPMPVLDGASRYRSQLAATSEFSALLSDEMTDSARISVRDIADGSYLLRVRGIDAQGLEGLSTERRLVIHTQPEPPLLIEPATEAVTSEVRPRLRWTQADANLQYRVQLTSGGAPVDEQIVSSASTHPSQDLPPGRYRWRVAAIDSLKGQGPWGDGQPFRRVLPGPGIGVLEAVDGNLTLRWTAQPQTSFYRLQVAVDGSFASLLVDAQTAADTTQLRLKDLQPGLHHVRVQATDADGETGPWGSTQTFVVPQPQPSPWRALFLLVIPVLAFF